MENRAHALVAGLFVLLFCAASAVAIWWFSGTHEATREIQLVTTGNISGLNVQAQVRYRGMAAGKVTDISIDHHNIRNILITAQIHADIPLTHGTFAQFGTQGVTGIAFINLQEDGSDVRPLVSEDGQPVRIPLQPGLFDRMTKLFDDILHRYDQVTSRLDKFLGDSELPGRVGQTLERIERTARNMEDATQNLPQLVDNINAIVSPQNRAHIQALLTHLNEASEQSAPLMHDARATLQRLTETLEKFDASGEQIFSTTLPRVNILLSELNSTMVRIGRLVEEIEARPQILISGNARPQPGPGEAASVPADARR